MKDDENVLARLAPIERAIMETPATTLAGLEVKSRHVGYALSEYWEVPIDQIDREARAVRLLIEPQRIGNSPRTSQCNFAPKIRMRDLLCGALSQGDSRRMINSLGLSCPQKQVGLTAARDHVEIGVSEHPAYSLELRKRRSAPIFSRLIG